jgi:hypothetical protein
MDFHSTEAASVGDSSAYVGLSLVDAEKLAASEGRTLIVLPHTTRRFIEAYLAPKGVRVWVEGDTIVQAKYG